jgi:cullin 1
MQVQERLRLPDDDLQRLLHSLVCAKYKIIKKEPEGKTISKTDRFR